MRFPALATPISRVSDAAASPSCFERLPLWPQDLLKNSNKKLRSRVVVWGCASTRTFPRHGGAGQRHVPRRGSHERPRDPRELRARGVHRASPGAVAPRDAPMTHARVVGPERRQVPAPPGPDAAGRRRPPLQLPERQPGLAPHGRRRGPDLHRHHIAGVPRAPCAREAARARKKATPTDTGRRRRSSRSSSAPSAPSAARRSRRRASRSSRPRASRSSRSSAPSTTTSPRSTSSTRPWPRSRASR